MNARLLPLTIAAVLALSACGGAAADVTAQPAASTSTSTASSPDAGAEANTVTISKSRFDNVELRVQAGTTVTFVNTDAFAHTVTSKDGAPVAFDSGNLGQDDTFEFTFDKPGEYPYFCQIHPTMRAVVIVE